MRSESLSIRYQLRDRPHVLVTRDEPGDAGAGGRGLMTPRFRRVIVLVALAALLLVVVVGSLLH